MQVNVTKADVDEAYRLSPHTGTLHFFNNPIAIAYARELVLDYCAVTRDYVHVSSKSGVEFMQPLLQSAKTHLDEWVHDRSWRLGPPHVF